MKRIIAIALVLAACTTSYDYDPASAGDPEGSDRAPRAKTSSQFLRGVYADLLGRTPETYEFSLSINGTPDVKFNLDEETVIVAVLDGIGDPVPMRALVVNGLLHSTEVTIPDKTAVSDPKAYITDQFKRFLGREPNVYELTAFADAWASDPAVGPRTIIRAITGSRAYQSQ
jgi:hypothetical protein